MHKQCTNTNKDGYSLLRLYALEGLMHVGDEGRFLRFDVWLRHMQDGPGMPVARFGANASELVLPLRIE